MAKPEENKDEAKEQAPPAEKVDKEEKEGQETVTVVDGDGKPLVMTQEEYKKWKEEQMRQEESDEPSQQQPYPDYYYQNYSYYNQWHQQFYPQDQANNYYQNQVPQAQTQYPPGAHSAKAENPEQVNTEPQPAQTEEAPVKPE